MRFLPVIVVVMGVLIVAGVGLLVWGLANLNSKPDGSKVAPAVAQVDAPVPPDHVSLGLPLGCDIADASAGGGRIFIRSSCGKVYVLDAQSLKTLSVIGR